MFQSLIEKRRSIYSNQSFAIGLVGIASCYLLVMIYKAYHKMSSIEQQEGAANCEISESLTYYYDTESYDWNQYESANDQNPTTCGVKRDFEYNVSIGTLSNFDNNEFSDMHGSTAFNINSTYTVTSSIEYNKKSNQISNN